MIKCEHGACEFKGIEPMLLAELSTIVAGMLEKVSDEDNILIACMLGINHEAFEENPDEVWKMAKDAIANRK